jgi:hypothetical protein
MVRICALVVEREKIEISTTSIISIKRLALNVAALLPYNTGEVSHLIDAKIAFQNLKTLS